MKQFSDWKRSYRCYNIKRNCACKQEARILLLALTSINPINTKKLTQTLRALICKTKVWTGLVAPKQICSCEKSAKTTDPQGTLRAILIQETRMRTEILKFGLLCQTFNEVSHLIHSSEMLPRTTCHFGIRKLFTSYLYTSQTVLEPYADYSIVCIENSQLHFTYNIKFYVSKLFLSLWIKPSF